MLNKKLYNKFLFIFFSFFTHVIADNIKPVARPNPCKVYLERGEFDAPTVCKYLFPRMTPEEINDALKEIRKFNEKYIRAALSLSINKVGEKFLIDILHSYGHVINFIEKAWVDRTTKRVFSAEENETPQNADRLADYWWLMEKKGIKLQMYKYFASCIDYLNIMVRTNLIFPCFNEKQHKEMYRRWFWWLEKVTAKLNENPVYGGYYQENIKLFREVFTLWKSDFERHHRKTGDQKGKGDIGEQD